MRSIRSFLSACCLGLLSCLGFSSIALAADSPSVYLTLRVLAADVGMYGTEQAKFRAEQHYMASVDSVSLTVTGLLARESNGYRLHELVNVAVGDSEVAKGKVGVGAGNVA